MGLRFPSSKVLWALPFLENMGFFFQFVVKENYLPLRPPYKPPGHLAGNRADPKAEPAQLSPGIGDQVTPLGRESG